MKRFQSILCASLLTLAITSTAFAGNITTMRTNSVGNITTMSTGNITTMSTGNITTMSTSRSGLSARKFSFDLYDYFFAMLASLY